MASSRLVKYPPIIRYRGVIIKNDLKNTSLNYCNKYKSDASIELLIVIIMRVKNIKTLFT